MDELSKQFRVQFYQEAREILDLANDDLMRAEANPEDTEILNSIFRGIHTIKGSAGSFELDAVSEFAHHLESLLNCLREGRLSLTSELVDTALSAMDQLSALIDAYSSGKDAQIDDRFVKELQSFLNQSEYPGNESKFLQKEGSDSLQHGHVQGNRSYKAFIQYGDQHLLHGYDPLVLLKNLKESSSKFESTPAGKEIPPLDRFEPLDLYLKPVIYINSDLSIKDLQDLAFDPNLLAIEPLDPPKNPKTSFGGMMDLPPGLPENVREELKQQGEKGHSIYRLGLGYTSEHMEHGYDPLVLLRNLKRTCSFYHCYDPGTELPTLMDFEPLHLSLSPVIIVATPLSIEQLEEMAFDPGLLIVNIIHSATAGTFLSQTGLDIDPEDLNEFLLGASELLDKYEESAMAYETSGNAALLNEIFRAVHTIKGDSDYLGLKELTVFSHALEAMLEQLRAGSISRNADTGDILLQSGDFLRQNLSALKNGRFIAEMPPVFSKLTPFFSKESKPAHQLLSTNDYSSDLSRVFVEQASQNADLLKGLSKKSEWSNIDRSNLKRSLVGLGKAARVVGLDVLVKRTESTLTTLSGNPERDLRLEISDITTFLDGLLAEPKRIGEILVEEGKISEKDLHDNLSRQKPLGELLVESGKVSNEDVQSALKKQHIMESARQACPATALEPEVRTMRVDESKIDQFGNLIGELLVVRNTYEYLLKQLGELEGADKETVKAIRDSQHLLTRLTSDIHHGVMALRMIPIRGTFQRFQRVVRDISRKQKKDIQYITEGDELEIDKKVADSLADPLIHLVRNACDHGIESPDLRRETGKPDKATVRVKASQEGSNLIIRVSDDGKGIDRQKLYEKVQAAGYSPSGPDDPGLLDFIFLPGLSTREQVTDVSGRGVGMDVVKTAVQALNGTVHVQSEYSLGTDVTLTIPMTMGISAVLVVEAGHGVYALPLESVLETLRLPTSKYRRAGSQLVVHNRGRVIMASRLEPLLLDNVLDATVMASTMTGDEQLMVVVETIVGQVGLIVDRLVGNMELAVKPVPNALSHLKLYSGVSLLGDGKVMFILNPDRIVMADRGKA